MLKGEFCLQDKQQPQYSLSTKILLSLLLALILGFIADPACLPFVNQWIAPLGIMFINLIKMMIVPLIFSSIIAAVTSLHEPQKLKRIGLSTIGLYLLTTLAAIAIGLFVANIIKPGIGVSLPGDAQISEKSAPALMDTLVGLIPANPVAAMANGEILPLIVFSLFLGMSILKMGGEKGKLLANFFAAFLTSVKGEPFPWLFIDAETLREQAAAHSFHCDILMRGPHYDYLARLTRHT